MLGKAEDVESVVRRHSEVYHLFAARSDCTTIRTENDFCSFRNVDA